MNTRISTKANAYSYNENKYRSNAKYSNKTVIQKDTLDIAKNNINFGSSKKITLLEKFINLFKNEVVSKNEIMELFNLHKSQFGKPNPPEIQKKYNELGGKIATEILLDNSKKIKELSKKYKMLDSKEINKINWYKGAPYSKDNAQIINQGFENRPGLYGTWFTQSRGIACANAEGRDIKKGIMFTTKMDYKNIVDSDSFLHVNYLSFVPMVEEHITKKGIDLSKAKQGDNESHLISSTLNHLLEKVTFDIAKIDALLIGSIKREDATLVALNSQNRIKVIDHTII